MIREERQKKKRQKHAFRVFLIVLLIILIAFLIVRYLFTVKKVIVKGNELYDQATIEKTVLNDKYSWNTLYVVLKYKFIGLKDVPFIDEVDVAMLNPTTLEITVYEKGMMGYIYISGADQNAYFDKDGFVVEMSSDKIADVPEIEGISCDEVVLYEKLPVDSSDLREILSLTQNLKRKNLVPDKVKYGVDNAPVLYYGKLKVNIGDTNLLTQKIACLESIKGNVENKAGTLHLENWTEENTNIVFDPD